MMKKIVSLIVLTLALGGIFSLTLYTLMHKEIKKEVTSKVSKKIELVNSNINNNGLIDIYNIYLNNEKHKLKFDYSINIEDNKDIGVLTGYIDGEKIFLEDVIDNLEYQNIEELFKDDIVKNYVNIDMDSLEIIKDKEDYLLIKVGSYLGNIKEKYYLINSKGKLLINGIVIRDDSVKYLSKDKEELNIFYDSLEQIRVKREGKYFYILEESKQEESNLIDINEYKGYIKNGKFIKELVQTYSNIRKIENASNN